MMVSSINVLVQLFQNVGGFGGRSYVYNIYIYIFMGNFFGGTSMGTDQKSWNST